MKLIPAIIVAVFLALLPAEKALLAATSQPETVYRFAVIPFSSPDKIWNLYTPFVDYLKKSTGRPWELKLYNNHDKFIEDICNGSISLALTGPVPLGRANASCGAKPLLVVLGRDGTPYYHAVLLSSAPDVKSIKQLKGKRVAYFQGSTAAHVVPFHMLMEGGVDITTLKTVSLESQDSIINALLAGDADAAGVKESLYLKLGSPVVRLLATSAPLPNFSLISTASLPAEMRKKLSEALLKLKPRANRRDAELVKGWDDEIRNGFTLPDEKFMPSVHNLRKMYESTPK